MDTNARCWAIAGGFLIVFAVLLVSIYWVLNCRSVTTIYC